jgi:hypothetical protein
MVQQLLAYGTLILAVAFLLWKYLLPKTIGKKKDKGCGQDNCGCN